MADETAPPADTTPRQAAETTAAATEGASKPNGKAGARAGMSMHVRVASPFKIFYDDDALSLSGVNATGPFDILPHHHNFISLLNECELAIQTKSGVTRVRITSGFMHVKADQIVVFLNV